MTYICIKHIYLTMQTTREDHTSAPELDAHTENTFHRHTMLVLEACMVNRCYRPHKLLWECASTMTNPTHDS